MKNTKIINLKDFILVGGGRWGGSFNHRENPDIMLKLYAPEHKQMTLDEYDRAQKVYGLGIPMTTKFISCAVDGKCLYIVSGDCDLLSIGSYADIEILTVADFLNRLEEL